MERPQPAATATASAHVTLGLQHRQVYPPLSGRLAAPLQTAQHVAVAPLFSLLPLVQQTMTLLTQQGGFFSPESVQIHAASSLVAFVSSLHHPGRRPYNMSLSDVVTPQHRWAVSLKCGPDFPQQHSSNTSTASTTLHRTIVVMMVIFERCVLTYVHKRGLFGRQTRDRSVWLAPLHLSHALHSQGWTPRQLGPLEREGER